jgi:hypothetical protein
MSFDGGGRSGEGQCDLTILMPCLDEAETVATCVAAARRWLDGSGLNGEILVADNGSTDGSQQLAIDAGARVVHVAQRGYGAALQAGIQAATGTWVVMGDADDSYDFGDLDGYLEALRDGADLVIGNRFDGGVAPGAMPFLHRYLGNPLLSLLGRLMFRVPIGDFHCGLRGGRTETLRSLDLRTPGMEYATEMIVRAAFAGVRIDEVPTTLRPDGRSRPPHLRTWTDGWRHLRFMLLFSPAWMFLAPGLVWLIVGLAGAVRLSLGDVSIGDVTLSGTTLVASALIAIVGFQLVIFDTVSTVYASSVGLRPRRGAARWLAHAFRLERGLLTGLALMLGGVALGAVSVWRWSRVDWGDLEPVEQLRIAVPAGLSFTLGVMVFFASLLLSSIGLDERLTFTRSTPRVEPVSDDLSVGTDH